MVKLLENIYALEVPYSAYRFRIGKTRRTKQTLYADSEFEEYFGGHQFQLPAEDRWQFLFSTHAPTEDQLCEVVEYIVTDMLQGYRDYEFTTKSMWAVCNTPVESFKSLLRSKKLSYTDKWYAILKKI